MNFSCAVCIVREAQWACSCGDAKLCESCVPTHLGKKTAEHLLSPLLVPGLESVEVQEVIRVETERLGRIEEEMYVELDRKEAELQIRVTEVCRERKEQLKGIIREGMAYLNGLGTSPEEAAAVLAAKERSRRLFELTVKWDESRDIGEIASFSFLRTMGESKTYNHAKSLKGKWTYTGRKVDAISLSVSRSVQLIALDFPPTLLNNPPTVLKSFDIVEGPTTSGRVLYSHSSVELAADEVAKVTLSTAVSLNAGQVYTLKAVLAGGSTLGIKEVCPSSEEGQIFTLLPAEFGSGEVSNLSSPTAGIFLAFHYLL